MPTVFFCPSNKIFSHYFKWLPRGAYSSQAHWKRGLIETVGLFNLETTMVSVLHKELEYKVEKLKYKKVGGHAAEDQNQIRTSSW